MSCSADVPPQRNFVLSADDTLARQLICPPTGEPTTPIFHVRDGFAESFAAQFNDRYAEHFVLLTPAQIDDLRLMGPEALSPEMTRRLGTFVGIALQAAKFHVENTGGAPQHLGVHGGLTPQEMYVPLIVV